jgi:hypothetical protein
MPLPTKKALPVFLYTKDVVNIDVVPATKTATYEVGDLISFDSTAYETGTGGYYQGTEINVIVGEKTDPAYTNVTDAAFLGIMAEQYPPNFFLYQDQDSQLDLTDYTSAPVTFAGSLERMTVCVQPNIILVDFWDANDNQLPALVATDIGAAVFISQTVSTDTGKAGKASLARYQTDAYAAGDGSGQNMVQIGKLIAIPVSGGRYGYVMFDPSLARRHRQAVD